MTVRHRGGLCYHSHRSAPGPAAGVNVYIAQWWRGPGTDPAPVNQRVTEGQWQGIRSNVTVTVRDEDEVCVFISKLDLIREQICWKMPSKVG